MHLLGPRDCIGSDLPKDQQLIRLYNVPPGRIPELLEDLEALFNKQIDPKLQILDVWKKMLVTKGGKRSFAGILEVLVARGEGSNLVMESCEWPGWPIWQEEQAILKLGEWSFVPEV